MKKFTGEGGAGEEEDEEEEEEEDQETWANNAAQNTYAK